MLRTVFALLVPGLLIPVGACEQAGEGNAEVKLEIVKHAQVVKAIEAARGKVVVVDVWAEF
jgi:hypothetical protein